MMKYAFYSATLVAALVPASAEAAGPYVSVELGVSNGRSNDVDQTVDFTTVQSPSTPIAPGGPEDAFFDDVFSESYKRGVELGAAAGYQIDVWKNFGVRLEGELGYKRAALKGISSDDITSEFLDDLNSALNRPSAAPDPGAPGLSAVTADQLDLSGSLRLRTAMANILLNTKGPGGGSVAFGGGYGLAWSKALGDHDRSTAWQYMIGYRHPIGKRFELGFKYRYFNSGKLKLVDDGFSFAGNPDRVSVPNGDSFVDVDRTTSAFVTPNIEGRYRSRSLSLTLTYDLGR